MLAPPPARGIAISRNSVMVLRSDPAALVEVSMARVRRVALVLETMSTYNRDILRGIYAYVLATRSWAIRMVNPVLESVSTLGHWNPDGLIAHLGTHSLAKALRRLGKPMVDVAGALPAPGVPQVRPDDTEAGRLAARHLLDRGSRNLAFFSKVTTDYSLARKQGFVAQAGERDLPVTVLDPQTASGRLKWDGPGYDTAVNRWLGKLPKPISIFACDDGMAFELAEFCRLAGLRVPEQVSLIGVDNDELMCNLGSPPLTSVRQPVEKIGYEAAKLLHRLMRGARPPARPILLPPVGVVARQSTNVMSTADEALAQALGFIRQNAHRPLSVSDVLAAVPLSRRSLEQRFRRALGRTPLEVILSARIERAQQVLAETDLKLSEVAAAAGFANASRLCNVFRRVTGLTPSQCRRQSRLR